MNWLFRFLFPERAKLLTAISKAVKDHESRLNVLQEKWNEYVTDSCQTLHELERQISELREKLAERSTDTLPTQVKATQRVNWKTFKRLTSQHVAAQLAGTEGATQ